MKKDPERTRAIAAFVRYAELEYPRNEDSIFFESEEIKDICAINGMFEYLDREGKEYISKAVRDVYMFLPGVGRKRNISGRVLAYATKAYADERTVYRWLNCAVKIFTKIRESL